MTILCLSYSQKDGLYIDAVHAFCVWYPGGHLHIKMPFYQYRRNSIISQQSYFYNGNPYTSKDSLYIKNSSTQNPC